MQSKGMAEEDLACYSSYHQQMNYFLQRHYCYLDSAVPAEGSVRLAVPAEDSVRLAVDEMVLLVVAEGWG